MHTVSRPAPRTCDRRGYRITLNRPGADTYIKISYPLTFGIHSEIETPHAVLQFNCNHEIFRAKGKTKEWIQPSEWLKRTMGNDWIYYSTGGYTGVFEATGEYYLPNLPYPTNSLLGGTPLETSPVRQIINGWHDMVRETRQIFNDGPPEIRGFLEQAAAITPAHLADKAQCLFEVSDGRITVMPPDARHVDYNIIPLTISHGCLYKCRFCRVKTDQPFSMVSCHDIKTRTETLKQLYGTDLINYNGLFLGEHDALNCDADRILFAATHAFEALGFAHSYMKQPRLFMFGSVDSLLNAPDALLKDLDRTGFETHINIGLESADQETLERIGKPLTAGQVVQAFDTIQEINQQYAHIEVTANFIMDEHLPQGHYPSFLNLVRERLPRTRTKGCIYLSPLRIGKPSRSVLFQFNALKMKSRLPTYLYIIQRL